MYYLSILAIMKNESMNLQVWIDHYIFQGVEHFYLIDNGSTDDSINIINSLILQGYPITLYKLTDKYKQLDYYRYVYNNENLKEKTKWLIIADLDEFYYCKDNNISKNLKLYEHLPVIYSQWKMFGHNNLDKHPKDIRIALTKRESGLHELTKQIFQTNYVNAESITQHSIINYPMTSENNLSNIFILNHYPIQSKEYFEKVKMYRGDVFQAWADNVRNWTYFNDYNKNATEEDTELKEIVLSNKII